MKTLRVGMLAMITLLVLACQKENQTSPVTQNLELRNTCGTVSWDLFAGQYIDVGSLTVSNDADNLYVTYILDYQNPACPDGPVDAEFGTLHLWVGNDLTNVPTNKNGTPVPGQFCEADGGACLDATGLTTYTFTIPFSDLNIVDVSQVCGTSLYVVAHAEVKLTDCAGNVSSETAFGGNTPGGGPRWWFYGGYAVCCDFGPPPVPFCQTAFAKGGFVFTTERKSNPDGLPSLNLTRNRWGWAINLTATGTTTYDIWAGAGLNKTSNGVKVGTLTVNWEGPTASVTYNMTGNYCLEEVHIYAGDYKPSTVAPGQYGHLAEFDPNATSYNYDFGVADSNGDGIWLMAHAVICNGCN